MLPVVFEHMAGQRGLPHATNPSVEVGRCGALGLGMECARSYVSWNSVLASVQKTTTVC